MKAIRIDSILRAAKFRPAGYAGEVIGSGVIKGDYLELADDVFAALVRKYSGNEQSPAQGPGTELKKLLKTIGIEARPGCKCNKRAQTMDEKGCDWCAENIDLISAWLQEEAERRGLPYIPTAGKWIINLAIKRARRGIGK